MVCCSVFILFLCGVVGVLLLIPALICSIKVSSPRVGTVHINFD